MQKTNIKNRFLSKLLAFAGLLVLISLSIAGSLAAQSINQGYKSDETLPNGTLVKQKDNDATKVEALSQERLRDLKGIVVSENDSPVVIVGKDQNVFVANDGTHMVRVSNENGAIKQGDYLSISSIKGVAMKANDEQPIVLGRAASGFDGEKNVLSTVNRKSDNKPIKLGQVDAYIVIGANPFLKKPPPQTVPKLLKNVSNEVAGRPVSNARIWLASIIFLATTIVTGIMIYGGAKSSLQAMGRNPLSKASILRGLLQVVILGLIVFICGIFGVYLLLKL